MRQVSERSAEAAGAPAPVPPAKAPRLRPRDAATLILLDRGGRHPKVLMGRRNPRLAFMPGKFVFPGGRIEAGDRRMVAAGVLPDYAEAALGRRVARPAPHRGRALALAAIRETYEETGLLLGTRAYGPPETVPPGWEAFAARGVLPDLEALHFVARAVTPPNRVRRFDTRFFAADRAGVAAEEPARVCADAEFVELVWVRLDRVRDLELPGITRIILDELDAQIAVGFAPHRPIPFLYERRGRGERAIL